MFAMTLDDFKRKLARNPEYPFAVKIEETCIKGTPLWNTWIQRFQADTNTDLHMTIEPDGTTYSFYKLVPRAEFEAEQAAKPRENRTQGSDR